MDTNNFDINKYLESLPEKIRNFVSSDIVEQRVNDISKKYSLTEEQKEYLYNIVLLCLCLLINPDNINKLIISDLGVSEIIADQIEDELESRIFDLALKQIEERNEANKLPEIKPQNLPVEQKNNLSNSILDMQKDKNVFGNQNTLIKEANQKYSPTIVEKKLSGITKTELSGNHSPLKYEKDPYREPLEWI